MARKGILIMYDRGDYIFFAFIALCVLLAIFGIVMAILGGAVDAAVAEECRYMGYDAGM